MRKLSLVSWALGCAVACVAGSAAAAARVYVVSLAPKDAQVASYLRLADADGQLLVTDQAVPGAKQAVRVTVPDGEDLFVMEDHMPAATARGVWGERARLGRYIVISRVDTARGHIHEASLPLNAVFKAADRAESVATVARKTLDLPRGRAVHVNVDPQELRAHLQVFAGEKPFTLDGVSRTIPERGSRDGKALARAYLRQQYEALGFTVSEQSYGNGINFVAEKAGADTSRVLILSSHLDSMSNAGADDDGAGTVSNLVAAKALVAHDLAHNVRVVAFDQEELGLVGSKAYARALNASGTARQVIGVLNMEMTAYDADNDGGYHVIDCNENTSASLTARFDAAVQAGGIALSKVDACTNRSDHASFWAYGIPAVVVSQNFFGGDSNPCYHKRCDKTDILNFAYMAKITEALIGAASSLVVR